MENTTTNLPLELPAFASLLDAQPTEFQEAFQFLLATTMHEAGKFELLNLAEADRRWHCALQVLPYDATIVRPRFTNEKIFNSVHRKRDHEHWSTLLAF